MLSRDLNRAHSSRSRRFDAEVIPLMLVNKKTGDRWLVSGVSEIDAVIHHFNHYLASRFATNLLLRDYPYDDGSSGNSAAQVAFTVRQVERNKSYLFADRVSKTFS